MAYNSMKFIDGETPLNADNMNNLIAGIDLSLSKTQEIMDDSLTKNTTLAFDAEGKLIYATNKTVLDGGHFGINAPTATEIILGENIESCGGAFASHANLEKIYVYSETAQDMVNNSGSLLDDVTVELIDGFDFSIKKIISGTLSDELSKIDANEENIKTLMKNGCTIGINTEGVIVYLSTDLRFSVQDFTLKAPDAVTFVLGKSVVYVDSLAFADHENVSNVFTFSDDLTASIAENNENIVVTTIDKYDYITPLLKTVATGNLTDKQITYDNTSFSFIDITETETGFYYGAFTHNTDSNWECTASPIECVPGDIFRISASTPDKYGDEEIPVIKCYDKNKTLISKHLGVCENAITNYIDKIFVVPDKIAYISVSCWISQGMSLKVEKAVTIDDVETQISNGLIFEAPMTDLYGKNIYSDGDSIAEGAGSVGISYAHLLRDKYNMTLTDAAKGGTTLAVNQEINQTNLNAESIYERMTSMTGEYDVILFEGGTNDVTYNVQGKVELGVITDEYDEDFDTSTTLGALEGICQHLNTNYFDAQKLFIFVNSRIDDTYLSTSALVFAKMKEVLEKWSIPYIDISKANNLGNWNDTVANEYFISDGLHPNLSGYKKFYLPYIEKALLYGGFINSSSKNIVEDADESSDNNTAVSLEEGSGSLTCVTTGCTINSASYDYQKIGKWVDMHICVDLASFTLAGNASFVLGLLPFVRENTTTLRELCVTTAKNQLIWAIANGSSQITFITKDAVTFTENEKLSFNIRYKVEE